jgi:agarase
MVLTKGLCLIAVLAAATVHAAEIHPAELGVAGREAYEKHRRLFKEVVPGFEVETKVQVNSGLNALTRLVFFEGPTPINGKLAIPIPFELNEHIFDFKQVEISGQGLDGVTRVLVESTGSGNPVLGITAQREKLIQIKVTSFMCALNVPLRLIIEGHGTVENVEFVHREGIAMEFDASIYREPGLEKPVKPVTVMVDATRLRAIEGITEIRRERYFRYYADPNGDRSGKEPYFKGMGFLPGRQIVELGPAFEDRYGAANAMVTLKEDPERPGSGYADPAFFERREFWRFEGVDPELDFVMCFDSWPRFMQPTNFPGVPNQRGTPAIEHFDAAADASVRYLKALERDSGRNARWWEVKNESDVKSEWIYHHEKGYDGWKLLADFHNIMADAIHEELPHIEVGGPVSAWFIPYAGDFAVWKSQARFMDLTRDHLDFYSHHFYEIGAMDSLERVRREGHSYVQGAFDCTMDMVCAHMDATGNRKPLVCSEYGSLSFVRDERGFWMHIKNINAILLKFLDRPQDFEITVPFMLTFMHWAPDSLETFIHQTPDGEFVKTKNTYIIDMWTGFKGKRIPVSDSEHKVRAHAVIDDDLIRLAVNNHSGQRVELNIEAVVPESLSVISIRRRMAFFEKGETRFVHDELPSLQNIPLGVDATAILEIRLSGVPRPTRCLNETVHYALQTAVPVTGSAALDIPVETTGAEKAVLRVGLYRKNGFSAPLNLVLNGSEYEIDLSRSQGTPNFFDYVEIDIDPDELRAENNLTVHAAEAGATVTAARITTFTPGEAE